MMTSEKPEQVGLLLCSGFLCGIVWIAFLRLPGAVALKVLVYQTDFGFDIGTAFISVWGVFKMSMVDLSVKLGDLHRTFKLNIEIPKCQIDTLEWYFGYNKLHCWGWCGIQGVLSSEYEKDGREFCTGKHRALKLFASMRNAEKCAIMPQTHFRNVKNCQNRRDCPGVNYTYKRILAGAKLRHIVSLLCRKNLIFSLEKPYITLHLPWRSLCILSIGFLYHFYIKISMLFCHILVVSL